MTHDREFDAWLAGLRAGGVDVDSYSPEMLDWLAAVPDEVRESRYFLTQVEMAAGQLVIDERSRAFVIAQVRRADDAQRRALRDD